ncbi:DUF4124 domain-containing protein [Piscinibacter sp.]|jgi:hypothetical protein|uniref:DUF4124 domain-containing protein n=1 Tax=Piscinibacter sp. TaxID=1903157 RepID=UPI002F40B2C9
MGKRGMISAPAGNAKRLGAALCLLAGLAGAGAALAATTIYTCTDPSGKKHTSDRLIRECALRDHRVLNPDGTVRRVITPPLTGEERAAQEARESEATAERTAQLDAMRRDRSLAQRFPDEAAHNKARAAALDDVHKAVALSEKRLATLAIERKPLLAEAEFYQGKPLPAKLKQDLDANDASTDAQRSLIQNQQAEEVRINALFDAELARLKRLWAGAPPGSMGVLPGASAPPATPRKAAAK